MTTGERRTERSILLRARDLAATVLALAGAQILLALLCWSLLFRSHAQGFALGLTLVGFASWGIGFLGSFRIRSGARGQQVPWPGSRTRAAHDDAPSAPGRLQARVEGAGCGTVLFLSGLVTLALAFVLRVRADMQTGMTWSDIFPAGP